MKKTLRNMTTFLNRGVYGNESQILLPYNLR